MGFDDGTVIFDRENATYSPGDTVHGKLVFNQGKVKTFRSIYLKIKGYCRVHWTTSHSRRVNDRTEHYTKSHDSEEVYFEQTIYLMGKKDGKCELEPGRHEFPFQCHIPPHCPSSFEHPNGHIRYEFKFVVDRPFKFDQEKERTITVVALRDLNAEPVLKEPLEFDFHESYCCWCMSSGSCDIEVSLPQSGFCPGQTIPVTVNCANKSTVKIDSITLQLNQELTFTASHEPDSRTENSVLAKIVKGPIPAETTRNWTIDLEIPRMDLYNVESCQFIDIDHEFEVQISTSGCHEDTSGSSPVVIGHIPLREFENDVPPVQPANQPVTAPLQQYPTGFPVVSHQFPGVNAPYDGNQTFPGATPPFPGGNVPYPGGNPPHPGGNLPYPGGNPPYPVGNSPYPGGNPPYPGGNPPYPGGNPPYPQSPFQGTNPPHSEGNSPFQGVYPIYNGENPPVHGANIPFPGVSPPYPGGNVSSPVVTPYNNSLQQSSSPSVQRAGFPMPPLPSDGKIPYPNSPASPFVTPSPSAPEPATPDTESKPFVEKQPAFNPEFTEENK